MKNLSIILALLALLPTAAFAAPTPEQVLADAAHYTVKIEVLAKIGLNQDEGGSHSGTGFLIDRKRGWILTNAHVATRSPSKIKIAFKGQDKLIARRVHVDPLIDFAVLEIDPKLIPAEAQEAQLDCTGSPQSGNSVLAYGHPWGLSFTASRGIVSGMSWFYPSHLIQTDAAINSGNSGGPLIDLATGRVLGINTSTYKAPYDKNATPVGLVEPIPAICHIVDLLREKSDARLRLLPAALATSGDDLRPRVAYLYNDTLGLKSGDIIISVNGSGPIKNLPDLADQLRGLDGKATLTVKRENAEVDVVTPLRIMADPLKARSINLSGLIISEPWRLDDVEANPTHNLVIDWIDTERDAGLTKAEASDYIESVNGKTFHDLDALYAYLAAQPKGAKVAIMLRGTSNAPEYFREYKRVELTNGLLEWVSPEG